MFHRIRSIYHRYEDLKTARRLGSAILDAYGETLRCKRRVVGWGFFSWRESDEDYRERLAEIVKPVFGPPRTLLPTRTTERAKYPYGYREHLVREVYGQVNPEFIQNNMGECEKNHDYDPNLTPEEALQRYFKKNGLDR